MKINLLIFLILSFNSPKRSYAQSFPPEGRSLNYRLIGFMWPRAEGNYTYKLQVAEGNYSSEDSFRRNVILEKEATENRVIATVPSFGKNYTWRVVYMRKHAAIKRNTFCHFSTRTARVVDTNLYRFRMLDTATKYSDALVFADDNKTLYDMKGNPVWFMPEINGIAMTPRDLKLTSFGTLTFLFDQPYEINYNGDVLWKTANTGTVSGDYTEHYHHEFTRLHNDHYMALGQDSTKYPSEFYQFSDPKTDSGRRSQKKIQFGTLIEYDEKGKVVWSWRSSAYFLKSDLKYYFPSKDEKGLDVHENAFYFDEKNNYIYVSYKNISRILKVKYPEGTVVNAYGASFRPQAAESNPPIPENGNDLFCGQHAVKVSNDGLLYLYNNNSCSAAGLPRVIMMREQPGREELKKVWEYECTIDDLGKREKRVDDFMSGGNVAELPDHSVFVCMSGIYSKLFIVGEDKKILWSVLPEYWNKTENKWIPQTEYRASIIYDKKSLESLIWNGTNFKPSK